jgi:drug/metabolite transporter (DMT)-like permease
MNAQSPIKGILFMTLSNLSFCAMACMVKCAPETGAFVTALVRFTIGMSLLGILALTGRISLKFVDKKALFQRGILGGTAICLGFMGLVHLGMIRASLITFTYPVFAALFSIPILRERVTPAKMLSIFGSFLGVALILAGGSDARTLLNGFGLYESITLAGAIIGGLALVYVKKLHATDSSAAIYFSQCLVGFWIVLIPAAGTAPVITMKAGTALLGVGIFATIGQLIMTESYRYMTVATGSLLVMSGPIFNVIAGALFFGEKMTVWMFVGAAVIFGSCIPVLYTGKSPSGRRAGKDSAENRLVKPLPVPAESDSA